MDDSSRSFLAIGTVKHHSRDDITKTTRVNFLPFGLSVDAKVRDEETERSKFDSRFIPGIWLGRATESDEHIVGQHWVYTPQGQFEQRMISKFGTVVSSRA